MTRRVALLPLLLAACGGLEKPDLESATVSGRIVGARTGSVLSGVPCAQPAPLSCPAAYAYPLGRPDLKVDVASDGTFELEDVPVSTAEIVLFDGVARAERVPLSIRGATINTLGDRYGDAAPVPDAQKMPAASLLLAGVRIDCGASVLSPRFALRMTDHLEERPPASGTVAAIWPVPKGSYDLSAVMSGFKEGVAPVPVPEDATVIADVPLEVDAGAAAPGCSVTDSCQNPKLWCDHSDGYCYECWENDQCPSQQCNAGTHTCVQQGTSIDPCAACTSSADCGGGTDTCQTSDTGMGYCSRASCSGDGECPSGFACSQGTCTVLPGSSCATYTEIFGAPCLEDETCKSLAGGHCQPGSSASGYCTSRCSTSADCPAWLGFGICGSSGYCVRSN